MRLAQCTHPLIDTKRVGTVGVEQFGRAHPAFPYERLYTRQRQFQFYRFGSDGNEEAGLRGLRLHRIDTHPQVHDGSDGRVGLQIELQELEKCLGIQRCNRQPQAAFVCTAGFQFEP